MDKDSILLHKLYFEVLSGMLGKVGEIKQWQKNEGKVFVNGELWQAVSEVPLLPGDRVVIQNVEGLTLEVKPWRGARYPL